MNPRRFFAELRRRNVYKVAVAYIVAGWALAQGIAQVLPVFDTPNWLIRLFVVLIILGLPIALAMAWAFESTPEGIKRTEEADAMPAGAARAKRAWIYVAIVGALLSIGLFFVGRYTAVPKQNIGSSAKSIAVLPFENISDDKQNSYFADGVQDQILSWTFFDLRFLFGRKLCLELSDNRFGKFTLDGKQIGRGPIVRFRPNMGIGPGVD